MNSPELAQHPRTHRRGRHRWRAGVLVALATAALLPVTAHAQTNEGDDPNYVTTTTAPERSLDVSAFFPTCIRDAPYVSYTVVPIGFVPEDQSATLVISDRNGTFVETIEVDTLSGTFLYPGATVDAAGNATDWPGWRRAPNGDWVVDPTDAILRDGLTIEVTVNPTATASVTYPPASTDCNGPDTSECVPGQDDDGNPADDCTPCTPGQNNDGNPADDCTPCAPGQNNDGDPSDDCTLPSTGGGPGALVYIGGAALLAGLAVLIASRRRNEPGATPTPG